MTHPSVEIPIRNGVGGPVFYQEMAF